MLEQSDILVRILAGALLGATIGYEREVRARAAGLRTHLLVGLAASTFMVLSTEFPHWQSESVTAKYVDPSRIAAAVVAGIGFLAGGAILRTGTTVRGLTTAAGLWLVTAIGLCCGAAMFVTALCVTLLGLTALAVLRYLEDTRAHRRLILELEAGCETNLEDLVRHLEDLRVSLELVSEERTFEQGVSRQELTLDVRGPRQDSVQEVAKRLCSEFDVRRVLISRPTE